MRTLGCLRGVENFGEFIDSGGRVCGYESVQIVVRVVGWHDISVGHMKTTNRKKED